MNVYALFEERTNDVFRQTMSGKRVPIKAKKLGKCLVRAMRRGIFKMKDAETAPALYTVLISTSDENTMRRALPRLSDESSMLVASQAEEHGYGFVGEPLVRFVADPGMRRGKMAVIADNVDAPTLARLRADEDARRPGGGGRRAAAAPAPMGSRSQQEALAMPMQGTYGRQQRQGRPEAPAAQPVQRRPGLSRQGATVSRGFR